MRVSRTGCAVLIVGGVIAAAVSVAALVVAAISYARNTATLFALVERDDVDAARAHLQRAGGTRVRDADGNTPLFFARSRAMAELLVSHGARVDAKSSWGCTPLHFASGHCAVEVVEYLLSQGADVSDRDYLGREALHWAVASAVTSSETGFDFWFCGPDVVKNASDVVQVLLRHGAALNARDSLGRTPLRRADDNEADELVTLLQSLGGVP